VAGRVYRLDDSAEFALGRPEREILFVKAIFQGVY